MNQSNKNVCLIFCLSFQIHSQSFLTLLSAFSGETGLCEPAHEPPVPSDFQSFQPVGDPGWRSNRGRRVKAGIYFPCHIPERLPQAGNVPQSFSQGNLCTVLSFQFVEVLFSLQVCSGSDLFAPIHVSPLHHSFVNSPFINKSSINYHTLSASSVSYWDSH